MSTDWLTAFLDFRPASLDPGTAFWAGVSGTTVSSPRGERGEFRTLLPPSGDAWLRVQRLEAVGPARVHLDLHTADPVSLRSAAEEHGAVLQHDAGFASYASPGGLPFCVVGSPGSQRAPAASWGTHRSLVDQVCIDIPHRPWQDEVAFWSALTGWAAQESGSAEFLRLAVPDALPLRLLLQRRDDDGGPVRAHLDLAADDPAAEVERVRALGASRRHDGAGWTTLLDPTGMEFCITDRRP